MIKAKPALCLGHILSFFFRFLYQVGFYFLYFVYIFFFRKLVKRESRGFRAAFAFCGLNEIYGDCLICKCIILHRLQRIQTHLLCSTPAWKGLLVHFLTLFPFTDNEHAFVSVFRTHSFWPSPSSTLPRGQFHNLFSFSLAPFNGHWPVTNINDDFHAFQWEPGLWKGLEKVVSLLQL